MFRSFLTSNTESVDQRASKLLTVKLYKWFGPGQTWTRAKGACMAEMAESADFFLRPATLTAGNFNVIWPRDLKFLILKYLNPLKNDEDTNYNFRLGFALSNRPHFNSVYLLRVPLSFGIAVCVCVRASLTLFKDELQFLYVYLKCFK